MLCFDLPRSRPPATQPSGHLDELHGVEALRRRTSDRGRSRSPRLSRALTIQRACRDPFSAVSMPILFLRLQQKLILQHVAKSTRLARFFSAFSGCSFSFCTSPDSKFAKCCIYNSVSKICGTSSLKAGTTSFFPKHFREMYEASSVCL